VAETEKAKLTAAIATAKGKMNGEDGAVAATGIEN